MIPRNYAIGIKAVKKGDYIIINGEPFESPVASLWRDDIGFKIDFQNGEDFWGVNSDIIKIKIIEK